MNLPRHSPTTHPRLHLFPCLTRISGSMNAAAYYFVDTMESEASAIAHGLRRRDPDLLDRLIEQYQHRLLRYLVYLVGNRDLAEDLFQETWIRVLERGHQYDGKHEFSTWLYAVARNLTIDYLRRKSPVSLDGLMEDEDHAPIEPADPRPAAWEVVAQQEQAERINAALVSIPAEYRETVVLRFQEGLALEEIATVTGAKLGTVKSRLYRGLNLLMSQLKGAQA
jgi:RNA polymerase sigma-70 factor, ECF subfamily